MSEVEALLAANAAYYRAFRTGDDALMARVWGDGEVSCIHPGWAVIIGRADVLQSYRRISSNPHQEPVSADDERVLVEGDVARLVCTETVAGTSLVATNLFQRSAAGWKMVHHQASPLAAPRRRSHVARLD